MFHRSMIYISPEHNAIQGDCLHVPIGPENDPSLQTYIKKTLYQNSNTTWMPWEHLKNVHKLLNLQALKSMSS